EALDRREPVDERPDALLRVPPHRLVLDVAIAEGDAEDEAAPGDQVECRELLGGLDGVVEGQEQAPRPERHALGVRGDAGESRDRLEVGERVGEIVLARPDGGEPHGAREPHLLDVLAEPGGLWIVRQMLDREPDAELHSGSLHTRAGAGSSASVNWGSAMWS